jgi:SAM-dependent methyltransferase
LSLCFTSTWNPRGELPRLQRLLPGLLTLYDWLVIVVPPVVGAGDLDGLRRLAGDLNGRLAFQSVPDWKDGRRAALQLVLESPAEHIQYADLDRLLRWQETRPQELARLAAEVRRWDCLVIGRTAAAYATHPQALIQTEELSNRMGSYLLGRPMDLSAGSKGFSRRAVEFLLLHAQPGRPFGADAEWPVLIKRAGYRLGYVEADGLDWESADRFQEQAAPSQRQQQAAAQYDADPAHWAHRTQVALEIVQSAIDAALRPLPAPPADEFNFDAVFEADDYMYFYRDMLSPEVADRQVDFLVQQLCMQPPMHILDLACGFGRHANRLAARGYQVTGIDRSDDFLEMARREAAGLGLQVDYRPGDMRSLDCQACFDHALLLFTAFGYFDDQGNLDVLKRIARALKPGGRLVFDSINRDSFLKRMLPAIVTEKGADLMIDRSSFDSQTGRTTNRRIVIRDGVRRDKPFSVRLYSPTEIKSLLPLAGFELLGFYGDWDGTPLTAESRRMIVIAEKSSPGEQE